MLRRKIQSKVSDYLDNASDKILIISGACQIGKSYVIRHEGKKRFRNFIEVDLLEDKKSKKLFEGIRNTDDFYIRLSSIAGDRMKGKSDTLIFLDEIQAYPDMLHLLKLLKQEDRFTYIVSGSLLGITLSDTFFRPGGRVEIINMYQLDFEEFLWANGVGDEFIEHSRSCFERMESLDKPLHDRMMDLFKKYLLVGGLPDAVNRYLATKNIVEVRAAQKEVYDTYRGDAGKYDKEHKLFIKRIYDLVPSNMENRKKRVRFNQIENKPQARASQYQEEFDYLIKSGICHEVRAVAEPRFPITDSESKSLLKLYLNDVGLLTSILYHYNVSAVMDDSRSVNLGSVYESVVCSELTSHGHSLYYFDDKDTGEIDFLVNDYDSLTVMPIEIKSGKDYSTLSSLDYFLANPTFNSNRAVVLSNDRKVAFKDGVAYLPIYYTMFLSPSSLRKVIF